MGMAELMRSVSLSFIKLLHYLHQKCNIKTLKHNYCIPYPFHHEMGRGYNVSTQNLNERAVKKNSIPFISNMHTSLSCRISLESSSFILRVPL